MGDGIHIKTAVADAYDRRTAWEVDPDAAAFVRNVVRMASSALVAGKPREAERYLREGLARDPNHPHCRAWLSVCVAARVGHAAKAEQMARTLLREHPDDAVAHAALGLVMLRSGRRRAAYRSFDRARELAPADPALQRDLARLEPRRAPVLRFLSRDHALNVWLGRLRARLAR
jgi:Tfp pilus assembly protein PilF